MYSSGFEMSGVEVSKNLKENRGNMCASCMNVVVQTFNHLKKQIEQLNHEKTNLQTELKIFKQEQEEQKRTMFKNIKALKEKLALLQKDS